MLHRATAPELEAAGDATARVSNISRALSEATTLVTRRTVLTSGAAAVVAAAGSLTAVPALNAADVPDDVSPWYRDVLARLVAGRKTEAKFVKLMLPELAENGNMVPFQIIVDSPMTQDDHIQTITVLSPANPQPIIATFELSPASGAARVAGRLRLARSQEVLVIAVHNRGALFSGAKRVVVTVGGCGVG